MARNDETDGKHADSVGTDNAAVKRVWGKPDEAGPAEEASPKAKREKVTGKQLEEQWAAGAKERSEVAKRVFSPRSLRLAGGFALLAVGLGAFVVGVNNDSAFESQRTANIATIKGIQDEIKKLETTSSTAPDSGKTIQFVNDARTLGGSVATAQNAYLSLGNGEESSAKRKAIAVQMDGFLAEGPARNARVPWTSQPSTAQGEVGAYNWKFVSAIPSAGGSATEIDLLWTFNNTTSGQLISWAIGTYDGEKKVVTKVVWGLTKTGGSLVPMTDSSTIPKEGDLDDHGTPASPSASTSPSASASASSSGSATPTASTTPGGPAPVTVQTKDPESGQPTAQSTKTP